MSVTPVHATVTVTTAGTRVQVNSDTGIKPVSVYFEAAGANTGFIYVGLVTVSSTVYMTRLAAGSSFSLNAAAGGSVAGTGLQLSALYVDSSVNGEKVQVTYMYEIGG